MIDIQEDMWILQNRHIKLLINNTFKKKDFTFSFLYKPTIYQVSNFYEVKP